MIYRTSEIHGLGPTYQGKLARVNILTSDHLMTHCGSRSGREELAVKTGLSEGELRRWTVQAELMRIPSVGSKEAYLLERAGIASLADLSSAEAETLANRLAEINDAEQVLDTQPPAERVKSWIADAGVLDPLLIS